MNSFDNTSMARAGTVVGLFQDSNQAERAIRDLKAAGFADRQIGVLMQDQDEQRRLASDTGTKAGEGAATGAVSGGVLGGIVGLLAGVGALAIPGVGPIIAGGALASTLAGAGIGAAAGGLAAVVRAVEHDAGRRTVRRGRVGSGNESLGSHEPRQGR